LWLLNLDSTLAHNTTAPENHHSTNNVNKMNKQGAIVKHLHQEAYGSPIQSTWIKTIEAGYFTTWSGLTPILVQSIYKCQWQLQKAIYAKNANNASDPPPVFFHPLFNQQLITSCSNLFLLSTLFVPLSACICAFFRNQNHLYLTNSKKLDVAVLLAVGMAIDMPTVNVGARTNQLQQLGEDSMCRLMASARIYPNLARCSM
jgi:hypothetical protein